MKNQFNLEVLSDLVGTLLMVALVWFAFLFLFAGHAQAFVLEAPLERRPAVAELAQAQANASESLREIQNDLRLKIELQLAQDIDLDFEKIPVTPALSDAGALQTPEELPSNL